MNRLQEIETRLKAIGVELEGDVKDLDGLEKELNALTEERKGILEGVERRKKMLDGIANMPAADTTIVAANKEERSQVNKESVHKTKEYRTAFVKQLMGLPLDDVEQRAFIHTTVNSPALMPAAMQSEIFSMMEEQHPILQDVRVERLGSLFQIIKHTAVVAGAAKVVAEGVANDDEQNTFAEVLLKGKTFSKHVKISYQLEATAVEEFDSYIRAEIAEQLGSAMAADIVAQIKADMAGANAFNAATPGQLETRDVNKLFGGLKGGAPTIYLTQHTLHNDVANMVDAKGEPAFKAGADASVAMTVGGYPVKIEDAVPDGEILALVPSKFIYNVVRDVTLERARNIENATVTIAGHAIAEGSLVNDKSAALLTVGEAVVTP